MPTRRPKAGRSCRGRVASTHLRAHLAHSTDCQAVASCSLRALRRWTSASVSKPSWITARSSSASVVLARSACTQHREQVAVEVDLHRRSHANSVPRPEAKSDTYRHLSGSREVITPTDRTQFRIEPQRRRKPRTNRASVSAPQRIRTSDLRFRRRRVCSVGCVGVR